MFLFPLRSQAGLILTHLYAAPDCRRAPNGKTCSKANNYASACSTRSAILRGILKLDCVLRPDEFEDMVDRCDLGIHC